ncbi:MAG: hypothetical protein DRI86_02765 [Bacteroidetes bacterium]|nr:MAG: hypothetical protein DRI86_02765 [Bacteroidota bacterium]
MELSIEILIKRSLKLYMKYGIRSVSMDDVAHELSVSKKTLYQMVKDKTDLVDQCIMLISEMTDMSGFCMDPKMNVIEKHIFIYKHITRMLSEINPSFEFDLKKYYPEQHLLFIKNRRQHIYDKMRIDLKQGIEEGYFREDINIDKLTILNIIRIESFKETDIFEIYDVKIIDLLDELFNYHLHGIATSKGIEEYMKLTKDKN